MVEVIGRRHEQELVDRVLEAAHAGRRSVLLIEGEAGMGKSTLVAAAAARAERLGHTVYRGGITTAETALTWAGLSTLTRSLPPGWLDELPVAQRAALAAALGLGADAQADPMSVATAVTTLLERSASTAPVTVIVDDLQWLDQATAATLAFAVRATANRAIAFVIATRPEPTPIELVRLVDPADLVHLRLDGLSVAGLQQLLTERFALQLGRVDLVHLQTATGGNPLYAIETGRLLTAGRSFAEALLPPSLQAVIAERLRTVPEAALPLLRAAALMSTPLVSTLERLDDMGRVEESLAAGERAELLTIDGDVIRFRHPLLRAGLLERLGTIDRRRLERRLAEIADEPEERAIHLAAAANGPDESAAFAMELAAGIAELRGASHLAAERWTRALELTPAEDTAATHRRRLGAAEASFDAGDFGRSLRHYRAALSSVTDLDERRRVAHGIIASLAMGGSVEAALDAAGELITQFECRPDLFLRLLVPIIRLHLYFDLRGAELLVQRAEAEVEHLDDPELRASVRLIGLVTRFLRSEPIDLAAVIAHAGSGTLDLAAIGELLVWSDQLDLAIETQRRVIEGAEAEGELVNLVNALDQLGDAYVRAGRFDEAADLLTRWCNLTTSTGENADASPRYADLAYIDAACGRLAEAERKIAGNWAGDPTRERVEEAQCHARAGFVALVRGDALSAANHLREARDTMVDIGLLDVCALPFWCDLVEALVGCGELDEAESVADEIEEAAQRSRRPRARIEASRARALVLAARGDLANAEHAAGIALLAHTEVGLPFEHARTLLVAGMIARRAGRRNEARQRLDEARSRFELLGAGPFVARANAELARLGGRSPETSVLTPTERQIARLVAAGRTNGEVAAELFVSVRTVESNLTRLYRKLGVRSRTELARRSDLAD